jgi:glycosyltransferase involved in cell wall biosynthesis
MTETLPLSVVIPVFNEEETIPYLYAEVRAALEKLGTPYDVLVVDDGSTDGSLARLAACTKDDPRWRVIALRRNFGQTAAIAAGFDYARGEVVVTLDGDLQNDPEDIGKLLALAKDHDVVSGWRHPRQDPFLTRQLPSRTANWLISRVTGVRLHDYGCTLKAYRREVIQNLRLYGEMHRFIPAIASWMGISLAEVQTHHRPRRFGRSKYGLLRTLRVVLDLITVKFLLSFWTKPIQVFGLCGLVMTGAGGLIATYLATLKLVTGAEIGGRPLLLLGVLLLILGVQAIGMGLLGEMMARVYHESQGKPIYMVKHILWRGEPSER